MSYTDKEIIEFLHACFKQEPSANIQNYFNKISSITDFSSDKKIKKFKKNFDEILNKDCFFLLKERDNTIETILSFKLLNNFSVPNNSVHFGIFKSEHYDDLRIACESVCIKTPFARSRHNTQYLSRKMFDQKELTYLTNNKSLVKVDESDITNPSEFYSRVNKTFYFGNEEYYIIKNFESYKIYNKYQFCYFEFYDLKKNKTSVFSTSYDFFNQLYKYNDSNEFYDFSKVER
jgi:hypothetical protein